MERHSFAVPWRAICRDILGQVSVVVMAQAVPKDTTTAASTGIFGPVVSWPIIPIHAALLPDGRVMTYGADGRDNQGAALHYDI